MDRFKVPALGADYSPARYNGTEVPYKNYGSLVFLTPIIRYHWTAALLHRFIRWYKFNWFNLWMLIITTLGVLVALIALFK